jgi:hypothetical protein
MKEKRRFLLIGACLVILGTLGSAFLDFNTGQALDEKKLKVATEILSSLFSFLVILLSFIEYFSTRVKEAAPGKRLLSVVQFFYSSADVQKTFKPIIADWRKECFDALTEKRVWKARWISIRYRCRFLQAMGLNRIWGLIESIIQVIKSQII